MILKIKIKEISILFCLLLFCSISSANEVFVSLKKSKVNVRYGPSFNSDVKYVYKKINLPIKQIDKKENFRRIIDFKNNSGWIHVSQLKRINSVIATKDKVLFKKPTSFAKPIALIKKGRLLIVQKCEKNWCEIETDDFDGWIKTDYLWGLIN
ncbi:SH3 domain-containing protein [Candidatus Pelagibacter sp.]|nr:SH3 domain-containing protein [Candidatus Pelagibacter sp.]